MEIRKVISNSDPNTDRIRVHPNASKNTWRLEIAATQTKPAEAGSIESAQADESFYSPRLLVCRRFANTGCSRLYLGFHVSICCLILENWY